MGPITEVILEFFKHNIFHGFVCSLYFLGMFILHGILVSSSKVLHPMLDFILGIAQLSLCAMSTYYYAKKDKIKVKLLSIAHLAFAFSILAYGVHNFKEKDTVKVCVAYAIIVGCCGSFHGVILQHGRCAQIATFIGGATAILGIMPLLGIGDGEEQYYLLLLGGATVSTVGFLVPGEESSDIIVVFLRYVDEFGARFF